MGIPGVDFGVAVDWLLLSLNGFPMRIPADKTVLSAPKLKRNWKVTEGFGIKGGWCVYTGEGLATFDATFEFWNAEQELAWNMFANIFLTAPTLKSTVFGVYHPALVMAPFRIQNVVITDIEGWGLVSPGKWQAKLSFLEYKAPIPFKPVKAEPTIPATAGVAPAKPKTVQDLRQVVAAERLAYAATGATSFDGFKPSVTLP